MYIHPKSLAKPINRIYLNTAKQLGAKIKITTYGKTQEKIKAVISIEGDKQLIKALKKLGIKLTNKPIPALFSTKILAQLHSKTKKPIPIGVGQHKQIIEIDGEYPIAVSDEKYALVLAKEPILWLDYVGGGPPSGFRELSGLPLPRTPSKAHTIAERLAKLLKARKDAILVSLKRVEVMEDEEIVISPHVLDDWWEWKIFVEDEYLDIRSYIDFSGLPKTLQVGTLIVASVLDRWLIIRIPKAWRWVENVIRYRSKTIIICSDPWRYNVPSIIMDGKVIRKINFMGKTVAIEENFTPFWDL